jgi:hydroxymethylpyrimidine pyrophosphatase-like HAD family hydrolase
MTGTGKKLLIFDVDGTLAPHGQPLEREVAGALCELEQRGHVVGFASGKTFEYLDGLARGTGLKKLTTISENGAVLFYADRLYPMAARPPLFDTLQRDIERLFSEVRLQHNMVNLTALAKGEMLEALAALLEKAGTCDGKSCQFYLHSDAVDLLPLGVDKGRALAKLMELSGFAPEDVIAVGNAEGDLPMSGTAGLFLAVGAEIEGDRRFKNANALMAYLLEICR